MNAKEIQILKNYYGEKNYKKVLIESSEEKEKLRNEFFKKYPNAAVKRFEFDVSFNKNGTVGEKSIFFQDPDDSMTSFNITSNAFLSNPDWKRYLYWSKKDWGKDGKFTIKVSIKKEKLRNEFIKKYPNADVKRFKFVVSLNRDGTVGNKSIFFQDPNESISSFDITSSTFLSNPDWIQYLYWPRGWKENGKVEKLENLKNKKKTFKIDLNRLLIFVTEKKKFVVDLNPIVIGQSGGTSFDYINNTYSTAIAATFVTTYLCGISEQYCSVSFCLSFKKVFKTTGKT